MEPQYVHLPVMSVGHYNSFLFIGEERFPKQRHLLSGSVHSLAHRTFSERYFNYGNNCEMVIIVFAAPVLLVYLIIVISKKTVIINIAIISLSLLLILL